MCLTKNRLMPLGDFSAFNATVSFVRLHRQNKRPVTKRSHPPEKVPFIPYFFIANYASFVSQQSKRILCQTHTDHSGGICGRYSANIGYSGRRLQ